MMNRSQQIVTHTEDRYNFVVHGFPPRQGVSNCHPHESEEAHGLLAVGAGSIAYLSYPRLRSFMRTIQIDSIPITLPFGTAITLKLAHPQRQVGWRIFVEMATRIATQPLPEDSGNLREALTSLHTLFGLVRSELKSMPPSSVPLSENELTVEGYGMLLLNHALRPFLARWHPRLQRWEAAGKSEPEWPLATLCRHDLEATRRLVVFYTWTLGQSVGAQQLTALLPPKPDLKDLLQLTDDATLHHAEQALGTLPREA